MVSDDVLSKLGKRLGNIENLPETLKEEIPEFSLTGIDSQVYTVLKEDLEGLATLSEILIALYNRYHISDKTRVDITKVIYRLMRKKVVEKFKNKKAVYAISSSSDMTDSTE